MQAALLTKTVMFLQFKVLPYFCSPYSDCFALYTMTQYKHQIHLNNSLKS